MKTKPMLKFFFIILIPIALKAIVSVYAFQSYEFMKIFEASTIRFFTGNNQAIPWINFNHIIYEFWKRTIHGNDLFISLSSFQNSLEVNLLIFLLKLPILIADIACGVLVYFLTKNFLSNKAFLALGLWLLNPYITIMAEMLGSNDLIAVAFMLLSLLLFIKKRIFLSSLSLSFGIAFKLFPILIIPVYSIFLIKNKKPYDLMILLALSLLGFSAYSYWVSLAGIEFLYSLMDYNPLTQSFSEITLKPYASTIGLSLASIVVYCFILYEYWRLNIKNLLDGTLGLLLVFFSFFNWYPQHLLWILPLLSLDVSLNSDKRVYLILWLLTAFIFQLIVFDFGFNKGLFFIPNYNEIMKSLSRMLSWINKDLIMKVVIAPILRACFAGISLIYSFKLVTKNLFL
jgi:Gpi18-like mannosyltransferase